MEGISFALYNRIRGYDNFNCNNLLLHSKVKNVQTLDVTEIMLLIVNSTLKVHEVVCIQNLCTVRDYLPIFPVQ